jgi:hypothetical protein
MPEKSRLVLYQVQKEGRLGTHQQQHSMEEEEEEGKRRRRREDDEKEEEDEDEEDGGLFSSQDAFQINFVAELLVKGLALSVTSLEGYVMVAIQRQVCVFAFRSGRFQEGKGATLHLEGMGGDFIFAMHLEASTVSREKGEGGGANGSNDVEKESILLVGDHMRSLGVLSWDSDKKALKEVAADFDANHIKACLALDDAHFMVVEVNGSVSILKRRFEGSMEEKRRLIRSGDYHLHQCVNKMVVGTLSDQPDALLGQPSSSSSSSSQDNQQPLASTERSSFLWGSATGAVGVFLTLSESEFQFMSFVQDAMTRVVHCLGGVSHKEFRSFKNGQRKTEPWNVVDGDLVEMVLDLPPASLEQVVAHVNQILVTASERTLEDPMSAQELLARVEDIQRLH